jgi:hypothetical protein
VQQLMCCAAQHTLQHLLCLSVQQLMHCAAQHVLQHLLCLSVQLLMCFAAHTASQHLLLLEEYVVCGLVLCHVCHCDLHVCPAVNAMRCIWDMLQLCWHNLTACGSSCRACLLRSGNIVFARDTKQHTQCDASH